MAKFLFCLPRYHTNVVPWVRLLQERGHEVVVHVSTIGPTENHSLLKPNCIKSSVFSRWLMQRSKNKNIAEIRRFPNLVNYWTDLNHVAPDVVIVRGVTRWFSRVAAVCAILQQRKFVVYDQEEVSPTAQSTWVRRTGLRAVGIRHVTSRLPILESPSCLGEAIPLPFGCPFEEGSVLGASIRPLNSPPRIIMVAKYRSRKGHLVMLDALSKIAKRHKFMLTLCGEEVSIEDTEFCRMLRQKASCIGILHCLNFQNNVAHQEMLSLYREHDLFVLPSQNEPAAVSPIEAAWSGCNVLITRDSGTRGYVPPGRDFDFRAGDSEDLARAIAGAIDSPDRNQEMRGECFRHITKVASDSLVLSRLEDLLK